MERLLLTCTAYILCSTLTFVQSSKCPQSEPRYGYPVERKVPYSFITPTPVALKSKYAYPVCLPKLEVKIDKHALLTVVNDGRTVRFEPYDPDQLVLTATGGPVFNSKYRFLHMQLAVDGVTTNTRCGETRDGVGFPGKFYAVLYNEEYGSEENSSNFRDGQLRFNWPVLMQGYVDNPKFTEVEKTLYRISKANSTTTITAKKAFSWLFDLFTTGEEPGEYYSFPGARENAQTKYSYCVIDTMPSFDKFVTLSLKQYKVFGNIYDNYNQPQYKSQAINEQGPIPLVQVKNSHFCVDYCSKL